MGDDAFNGVVKIVFNQRRNGIVTGASAESSASGGLTDCFNIRGRDRAKSLGESCKIECRAQPLHILAQQPLAIRRARQSDLNLFGKSSTPEDRRINAIKMIGGADQQDVVRGLELANLSSTLLNELRVMSGEHSIVNGQ